MGNNHSSLSEKQIYNYSEQQNHTRKRKIKQETEKCNKLSKQNESESISPPKDIVEVSKMNTVNNINVLIYSENINNYVSSNCEVKPYAIKARDTYRYKFKNCSNLIKTSRNNIDTNMTYNLPYKDRIINTNINMSNNEIVKMFDKKVTKSICTQTDEELAFKNNNTRSKSTQTNIIKSKCKSTQTNEKSNFNKQNNDLATDYCYEKNFDFMNKKSNTFLTKYYPTTPNINAGALKTLRNLVIKTVHDNSSKTQANRVDEMPKKTAAVESYSSIQPQIITEEFQPAFSAAISEDISNIENNNTEQQQTNSIPINNNLPETQTTFQNNVPSIQAIDNEITSSNQCENLLLTNNIDKQNEINKSVYDIETLINGIRNNEELKLRVVNLKDLQDDSRKDCLDEKEIVPYSEKEKYENKQQNVYESSSTKEHTSFKKKSKSSSRSSRSRCSLNNVCYKVVIGYTPYLHAEEVRQDLQRQGVRSMIVEPFYCVDGKFYWLVKLAKTASPADALKIHLLCGHKVGATPFF